MSIFLLNFVFKLIICQISKPKMLRNIYFLMAIYFRTTHFAIRCLNQQRSLDCDAWSSKHIFTTTEKHFPNMTTYFIRFKSVDELKNMPTCAQNTPPKPLNYQILKFYPDVDHILYENHIDLRNILAIFNFTDESVLKTLLFQNIRGFNLRPNSTHAISNYMNEYYVTFTFSHFTFFMNSTLITKETCYRKNFASNKASNFFGSIQKFFMVENSFYSHIVCPHVFHNAILVELSFMNIIDSLIFKNKLAFYKNNETISIPYLKSLCIHVTYCSLDTNLLNERIFQNITTLNIQGLITQIQMDLFGHFRKLKFVRIASNTNLKYFFHTCNTKWINYLNTDLRVNLSDKKAFLGLKSRVITLQFTEDNYLFHTSYSYPDVDFCLFSEFPHTQLVLPSLVLQSKVACSCTLIWLVQYYALYMNSNFHYYDAQVFVDYLYFINNYTVMRFCLQHKNIQKIVDECAFEEKLKNCQKTAYVSKKTLFFEVNTFF